MLQNTAFLVPFGGSSFFDECSHIYVEFNECPSDKYVEQFSSGEYLLASLLSNDRFSSINLHWHQPWPLYPILCSVLNPEEAALECWRLFSSISSREEGEGRRPFPVAGAVAFSWLDKKGMGTIRRRATGCRRVWLYGFHAHFCLQVQKSYRTSYHVLETTNLMVPTGKS